MTTNHAFASHPRSRNNLRSASALIAGFLAVVLLSLGTDQLLRMLGVFPPLDQPMHNTSLLLLAFSYRTLYGVIGSYIVASLAPYSPMGHALFSGAVGFILSTAGAIAGWQLGSHWYPVSLVLSALPSAWFGGFLHSKLHCKR